VASERQRDLMLAGRHDDAEAIDVERKRGELTLPRARAPGPKKTLIDQQERRSGRGNRNSDVLQPFGIARDFRSGR